MGFRDELREQAPSLVGSVPRSAELVDAPIRSAVYEQITSTSTRCQQSLMRSARVAALPNPGTPHCSSVEMGRKRGRHD
jgi:hypothetical protein